MGFRSLFTKGVAVTSAGRTSQHSRKASTFAKQAINCFRQAKSLKADKKIVMAAVKHDGRALEYASKELQNDKEFVMAAVKRYGIYNFIFTSNWFNHIRFLWE